MIYPNRCLSAPRATAEPRPTTITQMAPARVYLARSARSHTMGWPTRPQTSDWQRGESEFESCTILYYTVLGATGPHRPQVHRSRAQAVRREKPRRCTDHSCACGPASLARTAIRARVRRGPAAVWFSVQWHGHTRRMDALHRTGPAVRTITRRCGEGEGANVRYGEGNASGVWRLGKSCGRTCAPRRMRNAISRGRRATRERSYQIELHRSRAAGARCMPGCVVNDSCSSLLLRLDSLRTP
ncbi:hypothetical protein GY45DRAFT_501972 [Cubamyces sp. BRFM 1775]|nr:hypothetical protein GY45DRAFT_501972 [Cubamyces sp. BRFM 1775]